MKRRDCQKSGLAGEMFVAAELLKREFQVSLTLGNAKAIDIFAYSEIDERTYEVQVKTLRTSNCYLLKVQDIIPDHIYVFVLLHKPGQPVEYFILRGDEIINNEKTLYGGGDGKQKMSGILMGPLKAYKDRWDIFEKGPTKR
ncbi:MAG: hypothetical protein WC373_17660 [Smithella sp.]|jgi:hypothetical protein